MSQRIDARLALCAFAALILVSHRTAHADSLGSAITYQGQLKSAGSPANGPYNMIFKLWDDPAAGNQVGPTLTFDGLGGNPAAVSVANGLFAVQLDFGAAYNGNKRWLGITVNGTTLSPRQELTAAPYARFSAAPWATSGNDISTINSGNVGVGTATPGQKLDVVGRMRVSGGIIQRGATPLSGTNDLGLYSTDPGSWLRFVTNAGDVRFFTDGGIGSSPSLMVRADGNVGIGTNAPNAKLDVNGAFKTSGLQLTTSPGAGRVLTSDAAGIGTWQPLSLSSFSSDLQSQLQVLTSPSPSNMTLFGSVGTANEPQRAAKSGDYIFVVHLGANALRVYDAHNPAAPTLVGSTATVGTSTAVAVSGGYAYVISGSDDSLHVFNVSNPASPTLVGSVSAMAYPTDIAVSGSYAYVASPNIDRLQIFNVSNPASPALIGNAVTADYPRSVVVSSGYAYVICDRMLQIFDLSTPASPTLIGSAGVVNLTDIMISLAVSGGYAYVTVQNSSNINFNTLSIFNVNNPASPTFVGSTVTGYFPAAVALSGKYAYVVHIGPDTMKAFDVSNPANPTFAGNAGPACVSMSVVASNDYIYMVNRSSDLLHVFHGEAQFPAGAHFAGNLTVDGGIIQRGSTPLSGTNDLGLYSTDAGRWMRLVTNGGDIRLHTDGGIGVNPDLMVSSTGNVGIGTTNPATRLEILNTQPAGGIALNNNGVPGAFILKNGTGIRSELALASNGGEYSLDAAAGDTVLRVGAGKLLIQASGGSSAIAITDGNSVGIGTTAPSQKLHVVGNICATGTIGACSDERFKTHIVPAYGAPSLVEKLRPVRFDWKCGEYPDHHFNEDRQLGLIAQEVAKIVPEVVAKGSDGYYSVDYGRLTPLLVQAVKEEHVEVTALKSENAELKARLERVEAILRSAEIKGGAR